MFVIGEVLGSEAEVPWVRALLGNPMWRSPLASCTTPAPLRGRESGIGRSRGAFCLVRGGSKFAPRLLLGPSRCSSIVERGSLSDPLVVFDEGRLLPLEGGDGCAGVG